VPLVVTALPLPPLPPSNEQAGDVLLFVIIMDVPFVVITHVGCVQISTVCTYTSLLDVPPSAELGATHVSKASISGPVKSA